MSNNKHVSTITIFIISCVTVAVGFTLFHYYDNIQLQEYNVWRYKVSYSIYGRISIVVAALMPFFFGRNRSIKEDIVYACICIFGFAFIWLNDVLWLGSSYRMTVIILILFHAGVICVACYTFAIADVIRNPENHTSKKTMALKNNSEVLKFLLQGDVNGIGIFKPGHWIIIELNYTEIRFYEHMFLRRPENAKSASLKYSQITNIDVITFDQPIQRGTFSGVTIVSIPYCYITYLDKDSNEKQLYFKTEAIGSMNSFGGAITDFIKALKKRASIDDPTHVDL